MPVMIPFRRVSIRIASLCPGLPPIPPRGEAP
jgi:hypothetical protein